MIKFENLGYSQRTCWLLTARVVLYGLLVYGLGHFFKGGAANNADSPGYAASILAIPVLLTTLPLGCFFVCVRWRYRNPSEIMDDRAILLFLVLQYLMLGIGWGAAVPSALLFAVDGILFRFRLLNVIENRHL